MGQTSHTTILQDLPLFAATNRQNTRYFTLDQDDDSVNPALLYTINKPIVFHDTDASASCVSALFHNDVGEIHQLCSFTLRRQPLAPNILFLEQGDVLMTNVSHVTVDCNDTQTPMPDCIQCLRTLPCYCSLQVTTGNSSRFQSFWPPRYTPCPHSANITDVKHVVNLATLQSFFSHDALGGLAGNTYLPQPLPVSLPNFRHFRHKFQNLLSVDRASSHDLRKFANRVKNQSLIFDELADIVLHTSDTGNSGEWLIRSPIFSTHVVDIMERLLVLTYLTADGDIPLLPLLITRSFISNVHDFSKGRQYSPCIDLREYCHHTPNGIQITPQHVQYHVRPYSDHRFSDCCDFGITGSGFAGDLVLPFLVLSTYTLCCAWDWQLLRLCTHSLHYAVVYAYQFSASGYIESLLTSGVLPSYLSIQWPTFTATHIAKGKIFPFPGKIRISPWTKRRIRKIIKHQDFYVLPLLEFNGNFRLLDLATDESLRERSMIAGATNSSLADQPNLSEQAVAVPLPLRGFPRRPDCQHCERVFVTLRRACNFI